MTTEDTSSDSKNASSVKYASKHLFTCLFEMEIDESTNEVNILFQYPKPIDESKLWVGEAEFIKIVKSYAFPYSKCYNSNHKGQLVKHYAFILMDSNRYRHYGYCRSLCNKVLCLISDLPWYDKLINILKNIQSVMSHHSQHLNYFLDTMYKYQVPGPGKRANIEFNGLLPVINFECPDRRVLKPIIQEKNFLKLLTFFNTEILLMIFATLLHEDQILMVSNDVDKITSCVLALEYMIYPLEWFYQITPVLPEDTNTTFYHQIFPYIYGVHTNVFEQMDKSMFSDKLIVFIDKGEIENYGELKLPKNVADNIRKKLKPFEIAFHSNNKSQISTATKNILNENPIKAFQEGIISLIGDYHYYICYNDQSQRYEFNSNEYYKYKGISKMKKDNFYYGFAVTTAFSEFVRERANYFDRAEEFQQKYGYDMPKDDLDTLFEEYFPKNKFWKLFEVFELKCYLKLTNNTTNTTETNTKTVTNKTNSDDDWVNLKSENEIKQESENELSKLDDNQHLIVAENENSYMFRKMSFKHKTLEKTPMEKKLSNLIAQTLINCIQEERKTFDDDDGIEENNNENDIDENSNENIVVRRAKENLVKKDERKKAILVKVSSNDIVNAVNRHLDSMWLGFEDDNKEATVECTLNTDVKQLIKRFNSNDAYIELREEKSNLAVKHEDNTKKEELNFLSHNI